MWVPMNPAPPVIRTLAIGNQGVWLPYRGGQDGSREGFPANVPLLLTQPAPPFGLRQGMDQFLIALKVSIGAIPPAAAAILVLQPAVAAQFPASMLGSIGRAPARR